MSGQRSDPAAVIGVVVAGILASFVVPGPYAWDTVMLGLLLGFVLLGYGEMPTNAREALGMAAAIGFVLLFVSGHFLDDWLDLSGWPERKVTREVGDVPDEEGGKSTLILWLVYSSAAWLGLFIAIRRAPRVPA